jgi:methylthioribose-1-phosphate isomerase
VSLADLLQIRGAPAIASLAALSIAEHLTKALEEASPPVFLNSNYSLKKHIQPQLDYLITARPTAVNLGAAMRRLGNLLDNSILEGKSPRSSIEDLIKDGRLIADEDLERNRKMSKNGGEWLRQITTMSSSESFNILTVCNTGSLATSVCLNNTYLRSWLTR